MFTRTTGLWPLCDSDESCPPASAANLIAGINRQAVNVQKNESLQAFYISVEKLSKLKLHVILMRSDEGDRCFCPPAGSLRCSATPGLCSEPATKLVSQCIPSCATSVFRVLNYGNHSGGTRSRASQEKLKRTKRVLVICAVGPPGACL